VDDNKQLNTGLLIGGFIIGIIVGGIAALFRAPRSGSEVRQQIAEGGDQIRNKIEAVVSDPLAESMAEGKAAARRRRLELGFKE